MTINLNRYTGARFLTNHGVNDLNLPPLFGRLPRLYREGPMHAGKLIFAQVMEFAPWTSFVVSWRRSYHSCEYPSSLGLGPLNSLTELLGEL